MGLIGMIPGARLRLVAAPLTTVRVVLAPVLVDGFEGSVRKSLIITKIFKQIKKLQK